MSPTSTVTCVAVGHWGMSQKNGKLPNRLSVVRGSVPSGSEKQEKATDLWSSP